MSNQYQQPGQQQSNPPQQQAPYTPPRKRHTLRTIAIIVSSLFGLLIVGAVLTPGTPAKDAVAPVDVTSKATPTKATAPATTEPPVVVESTAPKPTKEAHSVPPKPVETVPQLTKGQEQAIGAAEDYLSFSAFSRKGLIEQLTSEYGSGFSKADATYAVDHVTVDWNEQAAKAAKSYLEVSHFSRSGLIEQLTSEYGAQFTHAQAVYGVNKAGL